MIYFDNAATSFQKPPSVREEVLRCLSRYGGNPGRGAHALSLAAAEKIYECRETLAAFLGFPYPQRVIFASNTTAALNLAIKGLFDCGDHVLISELEHNAVLRPLAALRREGVLTFDTFPVLGKSDEEVVAGIASRRKPNTRGIICTHASNICSKVLPISKIGAYCQKEHLLFLVDGAQSAGHLPLSFRKMHMDALAVPGHKALLGLQGVGALLLSPRVTPRPLLEGGSGYHSFEEEMPAELPERLEAGTLPTPAIAGLLAGVKYLEKMDMNAVAAKEKRLYEAVAERLSSLPFMEIYQPQEEGSVLLCNHKTIPSTEVAAHLNRRGICVRAGYHCAPLAHRAIGTEKTGALRVSFGLFNKISEGDALLAALREL